MLRLAGFVRPIGCRWASSTPILSHLASRNPSIEYHGKLFIDNTLVDAEHSATLRVRSPVNNKVFAEIADASVGDVETAVQSAYQLQQAGEWSSEAAIPERVAVLKKIASLIRDNLDTLSTLESQDCGKTFGESQGDIGFCADVFDYYASIAPTLLASKPIANSDPDSDFISHILNEPVGTVGLITPWNYPLMQAVLKVAPSMAAGCSAVLKPSPLSSLTCVLLGVLAREAGAPPGALNVLTGGPGGEPSASSPSPVSSVSSGQALADHPLLAKLSFTGSGPTGQALLHASAPHLRPTALELGGKGAAVVFSDCIGDSIDSIQGKAMIDWLLCGIYLCTGQVCSATSRILVQRDLLEPLLERLQTHASAIKVGDPFSSDTQMGPLVSAAQADKVRANVQRAEDQGCTLIAGGSVALAQNTNLYNNEEGSCYYPPTILLMPDSTSDNKSGHGSTLPDVWRDEIFGPVVCILPFDSEQEAISLSNDSEYGLASAVFTSDDACWDRMKRKLQTGVVWRNCNQCLTMDTPFGGKVGKKSGFGHEYGPQGLLEYVSIKTIVEPRNPDYSWEYYVPLR